MGGWADAKIIYFLVTGLIPGVGGAEQKAAVLLRHYRAQPRSRLAPLCDWVGRWYARKHLRRLGPTPRPDQVRNLAVVAKLLFERSSPTSNQQDWTASGMIYAEALGRLGSVTRWSAHHVKSQHILSALLVAAPQRKCPRRWAEIQLLLANSKIEASDPSAGDHFAAVIILAESKKFLATSIAAQNGWMMFATSPFAPFNREALSRRAEHLGRTIQKWPSWYLPERQVQIVSLVLLAEVKARLHGESLSLSKHLLSHIAAVAGSRRAISDPFLEALLESAQLSMSDLVDMVQLDGLNLKKPGTSWQELRAKFLALSSFRHAADANTSQARNHFMAAATAHAVTNNATALNLLSQKQGDEFEPDEDLFSRLRTLGSVWLDPLRGQPMVKALLRDTDRLLARAKIPPLDTLPTDDLALLAKANFATQRYREAAQCVDAFDRRAPLPISESASQFNIMDVMAFLQIYEVKTKLGLDRQNPTKFFSDWTEWFLEHGAKYPAPFAGSTIILLLASIAQELNRKPDEALLEVLDRLLQSIDPARFRGLFRAAGVIVSEQLARYFFLHLITMKGGSRFKATLERTAELLEHVKSSAIVSALETASPEECAYFCQKASSVGEMLALLLAGNGRLADAFEILGEVRGISVQQALKLLKGQEGGQRHARLAELRRAWRQTSRAQDQAVHAHLAARDDAQANNHVALPIAQIERYADYLEDAAHLNAYRPNYRAIGEHLPNSSSVLCFGVTVVGGYAIALMKNAKGQLSEAFVPLPQLKQDHLQHLIFEGGAFLEAQKHLRKFASGEVDANPASLGAVAATFDGLLTQLGEEVFEPIFDRGDFSDVEELFLLAPGHLDALPVHAAKLSRPTDAAPWYLPERFIVSRFTSAGHLAGHLVSRPQHRTDQTASIILGSQDLPLGQAWDHALGQRTIKLIDAQNTSIQSVLSELSASSIALLYSHGEWDPEDPMRSGIILGGHCLTLSDIEALNLTHTRLVFLAACDSGLADTQFSSDEFLGLPAAFAEAGCDASIGTMWPVDAELTDKLAYQTLRKLRAGEFPAHALTHSLREHIATDRTDPPSADMDADEWGRWVMTSRSHPLHWAAFTIWGG